MAIESFQRLIEPQAIFFNEAIINGIHIWKISTSHQAAILCVVAEKPLEPKAYKQILKHHLPQLSHISIEVNKP